MCLSRAAVRVKILWDKICIYRYEVAHTALLELLPQAQQEPRWNLPTFKIILILILIQLSYSKPLAYCCESLDPLIAFQALQTAFCLAD